MRVLVLLLLLSPIGKASSEVASLKVSQVVMTLGQSADIVTSYHQPEVNPLLAQNSKFQTKGIVVKSALVVGFISLQNSRIGSKHRKLWRVLNFVLASESAFAVGWNLQRR